MREKMPFVCAAFRYRASKTPVSAQGSSGYGLRGQDNRLRHVIASSKAAAARERKRPDRRINAMTRQLHLNLFIHSRGHHEAAWRHPDASALPLTDIRYYQDLAQRAEAALFDSIFFADQLAL